MFTERTFNELFKCGVSARETNAGTGIPPSGQTKKAVVYLWKKNIVYPRYLEAVGTIFYKFKLPEVQINLHFG